MQVNRINHRKEQRLAARNLAGVALDWWCVWLKSPSSHQEENWAGLADTTKSPDSWSSGFDEAGKARTQRHHAADNRPRP